MTYRLLDLFSGIGGFSLGLERTGGFETVAFCESDPWATRVLRERWPDVPVYPDVRVLTMRDLHLDGIFPDAIAGGFPCQDASVANIGGAGAAGSRTGLYREMCRLAGEMGICFMLMENVPGLLARGNGFGDVLRGLAEVGLDAEWECISARDVGADHERERLWILAYPECQGRQGPLPYEGVLGRAKAALAQPRDNPFRAWRAMVSDQRGIRDCDGVSLSMERRRLHALGNAVVPQIPELIGRAILAADEAQRQAA